jgi:2-oxoglutarate ferredoxin oxidoreductase subunit gamma
LKKECRLCGSGGQGIILAGIILAEAAGIYEDKHVTQVQDYGPAARGDSSKTDVVISDDEIHFPKCRELDLLVALSQRAYDKNKSSLKEDGILIVDSTNVKLPTGATGHQIPMTRIARDKIESPMSVNMVALGAIAALDSVAKLESLKKSLKGRVPNKTDKKNLAALKAGYEAAAGRNNKKPKHKA